MSYFGSIQRRTLVLFEFFVGQEQSVEERLCVERGGGRVCLYECAYMREMEKETVCVYSREREGER